MHEIKQTAFIAAPGWQQLIWDEERSVFVAPMPIIAFRLDLVPYDPRSLQGQRGEYLTHVMPIGLEGECEIDDNVVLRSPGGLYSIPYVRDFANEEEARQYYLDARQESSDSFSRLEETQEEGGRVGCAMNDVDRTRLHQLAERLPDGLVPLIIEFFRRLVEGQSWSVAEEESTVVFAEMIGDGDLKIGWDIIAEKWPQLLG